ncbi:YibE/F family protein [Candidatus Microgenomates bacterium]|nr:YibE/F family protein [Candidatus Microgenomates bacterium]
MKKIFLLFSLFLVFFLPLSIFAQEEVSQLPEEEILEGKITQVLEEKETEDMGGKQLYQKLEILITKGSLKDETIIVEVGKLPTIGVPKYQKGNEIILSYSQDFEGNDVFYITDFIRRKPLVWLFLIFALLVVVIGQWRGVSSLLGMGLSFLVIFKFILPSINAGHDPIFIAITGSLLIIPITFYLSHGFNKKTTVAVIATFISLVITGILAQSFVGTAKLSGYASEEAGFLQAAKEGEMNIRGLLLAGIIISVLGVLDDITVAQAAVVQQLKKANPRISPGKLFLQAMNVGQDHIASMVNTLVLVYAGASLPLLLLFIDSPRPFGEVVNYEIVAEEIIRILVGSIGLILAVPITTFLASNISFKTDERNEKR